MATQIRTCLESFERFDAKQRATTKMIKHQKRLTFEIVTESSETFELYFETKKIILNI